MPKDEKYEIEKKPSMTPQPEGGGLFDINPAVRRESQNLLADIGDAAGWGALLGGTALLFTPAAPAGATAAVTGLGALGAGAYLGEGLIDGGIDLVTGGTDVHLVLVDLTATGLDGQAAEDRLGRVGITVNRHTVPVAPRPPLNPPGPRIGTPALTTRGMGEAEMTEIGSIIAGALGGDFDSDQEALAGRSQALTDAFPLYPGLD